MNALESGARNHPSRRRRAGETMRSPTRIFRKDRTFFVMPDVVADRLIAATPMAVKVYVYLGRCLGGLLEHSIVGGIPAIAETLSVTDRTVYSALKELWMRGLIEIHHVFGPKGKKEANRYEILTPNPGDPDPYPERLAADLAEAPGRASEAATRRAAAAVRRAAVVELPLEARKRHESSPQTYPQKSYGPEAEITSRPEIDFTSEDLKSISGAYLKPSSGLRSRGSDQKEEWDNSSPLPTADGSSDPRRSLQLFPGVSADVHGSGDASRDALSRALTRARDAIAVPFALRGTEGVTETPALRRAQAAFWESVDGWLIQRAGALHELLEVDELRAFLCDGCGRSFRGLSGRCSCGLTKQSTIVLTPAGLEALAGAPASGGIRAWCDRTMEPPARLLAQLHAGRDRYRPVLEAWLVGAVRADRFRMDADARGAAAPQSDPASAGSCMARRAATAERIEG